ncbi:MAG: SurA N-terminal domain-containing protein, partial [Pseudomonadota bacterium]
MISFFRRSLRSPIALAILGIAIVAFIITGVGNPLGGPPSDTVATVGDENITSTRLSNQFDRTLQSIRQENPNFTTEQALDEDGLAATLDRLIGTVALKEFADRLGLGSSKRLVDAEIARVPAFQGPTGEFSEQTYRQILAQQRIPEDDLRRDFRDDVKRRHLLSLVADLSPTPESVAEPFALHQLEQRTLNIGAVPYQTFSDLPAPTEDEVEA